MNFLSRRRYKRRTTATGIRGVASCACDVLPMEALHGCVATMQQTQRFMDRSSSRTRYIEWVIESDEECVVRERDREF